MTPHIEAKKEDIANVVIMPGDPKRAQFIAEKYLDNYKCINTVRNMFGFTGYYKGKRVTVMAHGMGIPSVGIYSYELYKFYDVDTIIRIGTAGSYTNELNVSDLVLVSECFSDSNYAYAQTGEKSKILTPSKEINEKIGGIAKKMRINILEAKIYSSDVFYTKDVIFEKMRDEFGCKCVEMESFGLFQNAKFLNKKAACILTISDSFVSKKELTSEERQNSLTKMIELSLETALEL